MIKKILFVLFLFLVQTNISHACSLRGNNRSEALLNVFTTDPILRVKIVSRYSLTIFGTIVKAELLDVLKGKFESPRGAHMFLWEPFIYGNGTSGDCGFLDSLGKIGDDKVILNLEGKTWSGLLKGSRMWPNLDNGWVRDTLLEGKYKKLKTIEDYKNTCTSLEGKWSKFPSRYFRPPQEKLCILPCLEASLASCNGFDEIRR